MIVYEKHLQTIGYKQVIRMADTTDKYRVSMDIRELRILLLGVAITSSVSTLLGVALVRWLFV
jgi:hypothetical protein